MGGLGGLDQPGADYEPPVSGWLALLGILVVVHLVRREMGIRFRGAGLAASLAMAGILLAALLLFSVSLGLVAAGLTWAVALTSAAAFGVTMPLAGFACRSAARHAAHA